MRMTISAIKVRLADAVLLKVILIAKCKTRGCTSNSQQIPTCLILIRSVGELAPSAVVENTSLAG
jgi:hypothetical protein